MCTQRVPLQEVAAIPWPGADGSRLLDSQEQGGASSPHVVAASQSSVMSLDGEQEVPGGLAEGEEDDDCSYWTETEPDSEDLGDEAPLVVGAILDGEGTVENGTVDNVVGDGEHDGLRSS